MSKDSETTIRKDKISTTVKSAKEQEGEAQQDAQKHVSIFFGSRAFGSLIANYFTGRIAQNYPHQTGKFLSLIFAIFIQFG